MGGNKRKQTLADFVYCAASEAPEEKTEGNKDGVRFLGMLPFEKHKFIFLLSDILEHVM